MYNYRILDGMALKNNDSFQNYSLFDGRVVTTADRGQLNELLLLK